ncbi:MAG TPA: hypothetical protein VNZ86_12115, partial [Bacteroidia bacterium]|nr:hypothetical protein [Bacteroidia bacterium]
TLESTLGVTSNALTWNYAGGSVFELKATATPAQKIVLHFATYTPASFTAANLSSIKSFSGMTSNYSNLFKVNGLDATGTQIASIDGDANIQNVSTGVKTAQSMGSCALPTSINCTGNNYTLTTDLGNLLKKILLQTPFNPNINLYSSPAMTTLLKSYLPSGATATSSVLTSTQTGPQLTETLSFTFSPGNSSCNLSLTQKNSFTPNVHFSDITSITAIKGIPPQDSYGNYLGFAFIATYSGAGLLRSDTVFGQSCLPLQNCDACPLTTTQPGPAPAPAAAPAALSVAALQTYMDSVDLASGLSTSNANLANYNVYTGKLAALNSQLGLTPTSSGYVAPMTYSAFYAGRFDQTTTADTTFMSFYTPTLDSTGALNPLTPFPIIRTNMHAPRILYNRYVNAVTQYNQRAATFTGAITLSILPDSTFFDSLLVDGINLYIAYLKNYPLPSQNPLSELGFRAMQGNIPLATDTCVIIYRSYLAAYRQFVAQQNASPTCKNYWQIAPMFSYGDFVDNGLCCSPTAENVYRHYVAEFTTPGVCPGPMPRIDICVNPVHNLLECQRLYQLYLDYIRIYNNSPYALAHHHVLNNHIFISFDQFHAKGFCPCVSSYLEYLSTYINASATASLPLPTSIYQFPGCEPNIGPSQANCKEFYAFYIQAVQAYNTSAYATSHGYPAMVALDQGSFFEQNYCYCAESYINYLNGFIYAASSATLGQPQALIGYTGCPGTITNPPDPCATAYQEYLSAVATYNNYAMTQVPALPLINTPVTQQSFATFNFCYCMGQYEAFLTSVENGSITDPKQIIQGIHLNVETCRPQRPPCTPSSPLVLVPSPPSTPSNPCGQQLLHMAMENAQNDYNHYVDSLKAALGDLYNRHCLAAVETFTDSYQDKEFHFTLYYYDQAGNLIRTVPPEGVSMLDFTVAGAQSYLSPTDQK